MFLIILSFILKQFWIYRISANIWTEEPGGLQSMGRRELGTTERLTLTYHNKGSSCIPHTWLPLLT